MVWQQPRTKTENSVYKTNCPGLVSLLVTSLKGLLKLIWHKICVDKEAHNVSVFKICLDQSTKDQV